MTYKFHPRYIPKRTENIHPHICSLAALSIIAKK